MIRGARRGSNLFGWGDRLDAAMLGPSLAWDEGV